MSSNPFKSLVLWGISKGLHLPQVPIERVNELSSLKALLVDLNIDCVLDVGANRGQFARELRGIGYQGLILSFEPVLSEFQFMENHFNGDPNWRGYQIALGSKEQTLSINVPRLTVFSSLLESTTPEKDTKEELVQVKRLDALLPTLLKDVVPNGIFLKMDTQGYDLEVFRGATSCLSRICGLQSELSIQPIYNAMPHYLEALQLYESAGFDLHNISVVSRTDQGSLVELNCFMRRRGC